MANGEFLKAEVAQAQDELNKLVQEAQNCITKTEEANHKLEKMSREYDRLRLLNDICTGKIVCLRTDTHQPVKVSFE